MWAKRWWRIHWPGTTVWTSDECMSHTKPVLAPFPLISFGNQALLVLSQKVTEFPIRIYVEWRVPATQTQALQMPLRTLTPELSPVSTLHSLSTWRSPATCELSFLLAWVKTINTLRTTDVFLLPLLPHPVCLVHIPGSQFYSYHTSVLCLHFPSRLGPENLPKFC